MRAGPKLLPDTRARHAIEAPERRKAALGRGVVRTTALLHCETAGCPLRAVYLCTEEETYGETSCAAHAMPCCLPIVNSEATHAR